MSSRIASAQQMQTRVVGTCANQADGLILDDVPVLRHRVFLHPLEQGVGLHAGDEVDAGIRPFSEQPVVVVAPIINDDGVGRTVHVMGGLDVSHLAIGDDAETRQIAGMVEDQMQFDCPLGATALRPVVH